MTRVLREAFLAGVIWTAGLPRAADAVPLSVRFYNYAEVPEPALAAAQAEAAGILRQPELNCPGCPAQPPTENLPGLLTNLPTVLRLQARL